MNDGTIGMRAISRQESAISVVLETAAYCERRRRWLKDREATGSGDNRIKSREIRHSRREAWRKPAHFRPIICCPDKADVPKWHVLYKIRGMGRDELLARQSLDVKRAACGWRCVSGSSSVKIGVLPGSYAKRAEVENRHVLPESVKVSATC